MDPARRDVCARTARRRAVKAWLRISVLTAAVAAYHHGSGAMEEPPVFAGDLGALHHPIATSSAEAQGLFDKGLTAFYGFNRDAAQRLFDHGAALDPRAAMLQAGIALALGPNLNMDADASEIRAACNAARSALALAHDAAERGYAAALLQLRPRTARQESEIVAVLEAALRTHSTHVGANHLYIHAVEGSDAPLRALESAQRLATLVPGIGHLLHMPAHIYMRAGDYEAAIRANGGAAAADFWYLQHNPPGRDGAMYYLHDLESLAVADGFDGRFADARSAAREFARVEAGLAGDPTPNAFSAPLAVVLLRFHAWTDLLEMSSPPAEDVYASMVSSFARAHAYFSLARVAEGKREQERFNGVAASLPSGAVYRSNHAGDVTEVFRAVLAARLVQAEDGSAAAVDAWRRAVTAEDRLEYHEPPPFYYPIRESLGAVLLAAGRAGDAEHVFRDDLARHPGSGRSLFGLWQTLLRLHRTVDAERARARFRAAWKHADVNLSLTEF